MHNHALGMHTRTHLGTYLNHVAMYVVAYNNSVIIVMCMHANNIIIGICREKVAECSSVTISIMKLYFC